MSKIKHEDIASLIKERIDNFELNPNQGKVIVIDSIPAHVLNKRRLLDMRRKGIKLSDLFIGSINSTESYAGGWVYNVSPSYTPDVNDYDKINWVVFVTNEGASLHFDRENLEDCLSGKLDFRLDSEFLFKEGCQFVVNQLISRGATELQKIKDNIVFQTDLPYPSNDMVCSMSMVKLESAELIRPLSLLCKQDKKKDRFGNYIKQKFK